MATRLTFHLVNEDTNTIFSEWAEQAGDELTYGDIYRMCQGEYGRCTSKIYVDRTSAPPLHVGWFFVSRQRYEDTGQPYLRGAWVTFHRIPDNEDGDA